MSTLENLNEEYYQKHISEELYNKAKSFENQKKILQSFTYIYEMLARKSLNADKAVDEETRVSFLNAYRKFGLYQARIIRSNGDEYFRYDYTQNAQFQKSKTLQNKAKRDYFLEMMQADYELGKVYFSELNLNQENGSIEMPYRPTILTMVKIKEGNELYLLVLNFNLDILLHDILSSNEYDVFLTQSDGEINYHQNVQYAFSKDLHKSLYVDTLYPNLPKQFQKLSFPGHEFRLYVVPKKEGYNRYIEHLEKLHTTKMIFSLVVSLVLALLLSFFIKSIFKKLEKNVTAILAGRTAEIESENSCEEVALILENISDTHRRINAQKEQYVQQLAQEVRKSRRIFDSQNAITIITDGHDIVDMNHLFFEYFNYEDLEDFKKQHRCICELFIDKEGMHSLMPTMDGQNWIEYILSDSGNVHKAYMLDKEAKERVYSVKVTTMDESSSNHNIILFIDITESEEIQNIMLVQNRHAAMGEMIAMIAHQWKQPLATLSLINTKLRTKYELEKLTKEDFADGYVKQKQLIKHLSDTIDDFRNFFHNGRGNIEKVALEKILGAPYAMLYPLFQANAIDFKIFYEGDIEKDAVGVLQSKVNQVLINIYKNALDELIRKQIKDAHIYVYCAKEKNKVSIKVCDNAGGVPEDIIAKIFEPYFSTKSKNGTGIGLYMSKTICEQHLHGELCVHNEAEGACFEMSFKV